MCVIQEALAKSSAAESRIRADTEAAVKSMRAAAGAACSCTGRPAAAGDCRRCMLRRVAERLRDAGYNSALCTSKWTRSPDIPSGNPRLPIFFFYRASRQSSQIFFSAETHDDQSITKTRREEHTNEGRFSEGKILSMSPDLVHVHAASGSTTDLLCLAPGHVTRMDFFFCWRDEP